ncbi:2549_t:CDS:1, partial [Paraglomus brasilianum]
MSDYPQQQQQNQSSLDTDNQQEHMNDSPPRDSMQWEPVTQGEPAMPLPSTDTYTDAKVQDLQTHLP